MFLCFHLSVDQDSGVLQACLRPRDLRPNPAFVGAVSETCRDTQGVSLPPEALLVHRPMFAAAEPLEVPGLLKCECLCASFWRQLFFVISQDRRRKLTLVSGPSVFGGFSRCAQEVQYDLDPQSRKGCPTVRGFGTGSSTPNRTARRSARICMADSNPNPCKRLTTNRVGFGPLLPTNHTAEERNLV